MKRLSIIAFVVAVFLTCAPLLLLSGCYGNGANNIVWRYAHSNGPNDITSNTLIAPPWATVSGKINSTTATIEVGQSLLLSAIGAAGAWAVKP